MLASEGQLSAWVVTENARDQCGDAVLALAELLLDRCIQALERAIETLLEPVQQRGQARFQVANGKAGQPLTGLQKLEARGAFQPMRLRCEALADSLLSFGDGFCSSGGGGRSQVGGKVRDGEVGFVSDSGNDRQP